MKNLEEEIEGNYELDKELVFEKERFIYEEPLGNLAKISQEFFEVDLNDMNCQLIKMEELLDVNFMVFEEFLKS